MPKTFAPRLKAVSALLLIAAICCLSGACLAVDGYIDVNINDYPVTEDGGYTSLEEVAVYLSVYGRLPSNFITKDEAEARGWSSREGNLGVVAPGKSIGGDRFGNYEKQLPTARGLTYIECDIDFTGSFRNARRIIYSSDGLIYFTGDHYNSFQQVLVVSPKQAGELSENGSYTGKYDVALYIRTFGRLPGNFVKKSEAEKQGFTNKKDNLGKVMPGYAIGGDAYQNREKRLPSASGRKWYQCDVNTVDGKRGEQRLVYSSDGMVYYSPDNLFSFEQIY